METLEELNKRRTARLDEQKKARDAQELIDLTAIDALEVESGAPLNTMTCNGFKLGVPVRIAFRCPTSAEYRRYNETVSKAHQNKDAVGRREGQELLAKACLVYPPVDSDERKALLAGIPGLLISLSIEAAKVAEAEAVNEGKD